MIHVLSLAGALAISFSAIFVRLAGVSPSTAAFYRCAYALPVLFAIWFAARGRDRRRSPERWMAVLAGLLFALDLTFWHRSIADIGAGMSTVLGNTQILFVGILAWGLLGERPTRAALVLVPVVFLGVALSSGLGRPDAFGAEPVRGAVYGVLTGISYALFLLVFRRSNRSLAPTAGPLLDATAGAALGVVAAAPFDAHFSVALSWPAHGWLILLALLVQVLGWLLIANGLPRLAALETSVILLVQPMATLLWGFLVFAEQPSGVQWAGIGLVLAGVSVLSVTGSVEAARRREPVPETVPMRVSAPPGP